MDVLLTIGEFSKMTYLSVKALRHYHDVGLLSPAAIDASTGYRRYAASQVAKAQAIRRFRDLGMPLDDVRQVIAAPDLARMHEQLERTQISVASLQALLTADARPGGDVEIRRLPATRVVSVTRVVEFDACSEWLTPALGELHDTVARRGLDVAGPDGALYSDAFFEAGEGEVVAFLPVEGDDPTVVELPATTAAVLVHRGPFQDVDQTYAALGTVVAERGIGGPGPIRENYLDPAITEVCWPVATGDPR